MNSFVKYFLLLLSLMFIVYLTNILYKKSKLNDKNNTNLSNVTDRPVPTKNNTLIKNINNYSLYHSKMNYSKVSLINNLSVRHISSDNPDIDPCKYLLSSYFYDEDFKPLGILVIEDSKLSIEKKNNILNAYVGFSDSKIYISDAIKGADFQSTLFQTGPLIKFDGKYQTLFSQNSDNGRRVLIATSDNDVFMFLLIDPEKLYSGPMLQELPEIFKEFEISENIIFDNIVNLDGGSASVFKNEDIFIHEYSTVGGFLCFE